MTTERAITTKMKSIAHDYEEALHSILDDLITWASYPADTVVKKEFLGTRAKDIHNVLKRNERYLRGW